MTAMMVDAGHPKLGDRKYTEQPQLCSLSVISGKYIGKQLIPNIGQHRRKDMVRNESPALMANCMGKYAWRTHSQRPSFLPCSGVDSPSIGL